MNPTLDDDKAVYRVFDQPNIQSNKGGKKDKFQKDNENCRELDSPNEKKGDKCSAIMNFNDDDYRPSNTKSPKNRINGKDFQYHSNDCCDYDKNDNLNGA